MATSTKYTIQSPLGEDSIKGGVFFGSSLIPQGTFSNVPKYFTSTPTIEQQNEVLYTLQKIKDSIKENLKEEYSSDSFDDSIVERFLVDYTSLLIDYKDLRNYIFFGSAHTELAYYINKTIKEYPYKSLISTNDLSKIEIKHDIVNNYTIITFSEECIRDIGSFSKLDDNTSISWADFNLIDKNNNKYEVVNVFAPYLTNSSFIISQIENGTKSVKITTNLPHGYQRGQFVYINGVQGLGEELNGKTFIVGSDLTSPITSNTFEIFEIITNNYIFIDDTDAPLLTNLINISPAFVRLFPASANDLSGNDERRYRITIKGSFTEDQFLSYIDDTEGYAGFLLSPKNNIISEFEFNLSEIQKILLAPSPINPTPWPRRIITGNIQNKFNIQNPEESDEEFATWIQSPNLLYQSDNSLFDDSIAYSNTALEYNLLKALALDETYSNQLLRRAIPNQILNEEMDAEGQHFTRFILMAGWAFDSIYPYIKFIKYIHHLNYTDFNQLSPEYYKLYAEYYGLDLFDDDSIDFAKLLVKTEPGLTYVLNQPAELNNKSYRQTLQQLQYEKQKRLLLSLFYLYKTKGTSGTIKKLIALLGAPEGLLIFNEFAFSLTPLEADTDKYIGATSGNKIIDNDKIHVPKYHFEIDADYLRNKTNLDDPKNKPYVYKARLHNESIVNLREIAIGTHPNQAIDSQLVSFFGQLKYDYVKFNNGEFANLQNREDEYFVLPLSLPDKYFGITTTYMIPRGGYVKGVGNNLEESNVHLASLYQIEGLVTKPEVSIASVHLEDEDELKAILTTSVRHYFAAGDIIAISTLTGENDVFTIRDVPDRTTIIISGTFPLGIPLPAIASMAIPNTLSKGFRYSYPMPINFSNYNQDTFENIDTQNPPGDFNIFKEKFSDDVPENSIMSYNIYKPFIINRVEGNDLVSRIRIDSERPSQGGQYHEYVAIFQNLFSDDGLNHTLRLIFRAEGIEIYQDYKFRGLAKWRNPITNSSGIFYKVIEIPKKDILTCEEEIIDIGNLIVEGTNLGADRIRWWDLFIGLPTNLEIYFNKINIFENNSIDSFNENDNIFNNNNYNSDSYLFNFTNTTAIVSNNIEEFKTTSRFVKANPNTPQANYYYLLPENVDDDNGNIIVSKLELSSKSIINKNIEEEFASKIYFNKPQDFFNYIDSFKAFGWQKDLYKSYDYENFSGKLLEVYNLYSTQVLTYQSLLSFLDLIENRLRRTIQQFIPIVINISEFGRIIQNSLFKAPKVRYSDIHKKCNWKVGATNSSAQTNIFKELDIESDVSIGILMPNEVDYLIPTFTITWQGTLANTLVAIVEQFNTYFPNSIAASVLGQILRIEIDFEWFRNTYSLDANDLILVYNSTDDDVVFVKFNYGSIELENDNACVIVSYTVPKEEQQPPIYIFFDEEEDKQDPVVYLNVEDINNKDQIFL